MRLGECARFHLAPKSGGAEGQRGWAIGALGALHQLRFAYKGAVGQGVEADCTFIGRGTSWLYAISVVLHLPPLVAGASNESVDLARAPHRCARASLYGGGELAAFDARVPAGAGDGKARKNLR